MDVIAMLLLQADGSRVLSLSLSNMSTPLCRHEHLERTLTDAWHALRELELIGCICTNDWMEILANGAFPNLATLKLCHTNHSLDMLADALACTDLTLDIVIHPDDAFDELDVMCYSSPDIHDTFLTGGVPPDKLTWGKILATANHVRWLRCYCEDGPEHCRAVHSA